MLTNMFILLLTGLLSFSFSPCLCSASTLVPFRSCNALYDYMVSNGVKRVGPWGLSYHFLGCNRYRFRSLNPGFSQSAVSPSSSTNPVQGVDFSGTNVQVSGVDEPDIVKTDGNRIFVISRNNFFHIVVGNDGGASGKIVANFTLPTYPLNMLFEGNNVVVISQDSEQVKLFSTKEEAITAGRLSIFGRRRPVTVLYRIDVSNNGAFIKETLRMYGSYVSARAVKGVARIVTTYDASGYLPFAYPSENLTQQEATEVNKDVVRDTKLSDWLPAYKLIRVKDGCMSAPCANYSVYGTLSGCSTDLFYPKDTFSGFSLLTVSTVQLGGPLIPRGVSIAADGRTVYATASSLYVATTKYRWDFGPNPSIDLLRLRFSTSFHKFSLIANTSQYIASGEVKGSTLNQFSMHEFNETFFVATQIGASWSRLLRDSSSSKVSSFRVSTGRLMKKVGEVGGLGKGQRITAVRYVKNFAYVVTFRQIDPLYIIDLSDAYNLRATGELNVTGFSSYLHPIKPGRILGVGQEVNTQGFATGAKVSLFNVSNIRKPREIDSWSLRGSYSNVQWNHLAFLYWKPERLAVLPISVYSTNVTQRFVGSIALEVTDKGIRERGRIWNGCCGHYWNWAVLRNFIIAKQYLWSLSNRAVQVNSIKGLMKKSVIRFWK